jgi:hypothetical protein
MGFPKIPEMDMLAFAIDIQAYIKFRSLQKGDKNSIFGQHTKTEKLDAAKKLFKLLQGEIIVFSRAEISTIRNGRLGDICRMHTKKKNRYHSLSDFLIYYRTNLYSEESRIEDLSVDVNHYTGCLSNRIKAGKYDSKKIVWAEARKMSSSRTLLDRIGTCIDLHLDLCKEQISDGIFTETPFKHWKLIERLDLPPVMKFNVLGNFYYISNRKSDNGELRHDVFLDIIKNNPSLNISTLLSEYPFDLVFLLAKNQELVDKLANIQGRHGNTSKNNQLRQSTFKKYYGY